MSYVTVALSEPTEPLTYRLTAETLLGSKPGVLLEVPFGNRLVLGVALTLERTVGSDIKEKLRPVKRILSDGVWAPSSTIRLAQAMSTYAKQPLGTCLFRLLPPAGKRGNHSVRPAASRLPAKTLHVYGPRMERLAQYRTLIGKAVAGRRQVILVAPAYEHEWLGRELIASQKHLRGDQAIHLEGVSGAAPSADQTIHLGGVDESTKWRVRTVSGDLSPTKQRQIAEDLATGMIDLLITTRHAIGWPAYALGAVIVDDPHHQAHIDEQRPYLDSATIALLRSQVDGGYAVLGTSLPTPTLVLREQRELACRLVAFTKIPLNPPFPKGEVNPLLLKRSLPDLVIQAGVGEDLTQSVPTKIRILKSSTRQQVLPDVVRLLGEALEAGAGALVVAPRHGLEGGPFGVDTESVRVWFTEHEPALLTSGLVIDTEGALEQQRRWGAIAFLYAESPLSSPDLLRPVRYLSAIVEAQGLADHVFVQSHEPEQAWLRCLGSPQALQEIITERQQAKLPPQYRTAHVIGHNANATEAADKLTSYDLGQIEQRDGSTQIDIHYAPERGDSLIQLQQLLGRKWTVKADSVLEHAQAATLSSPGSLRAPRSNLVSRKL